MTNTRTLMPSASVRVAALALVLASSATCAQSGGAVFDSPAVSRLQSIKTYEKLPMSAANLVPVSVDGQTLWVLPVLNESRSRSLRIRSYLVKSESGATTLFYPVVSLVGPAGQIVSTVKPKVEFAFSDDVLVNEFSLPPDTERFVIHTSREFYESGFEGSRLYKGPSKGQLMGLGIALGGFLGGFVAGLPLDTAASTFTLGKEGLISVESD